jgi:radical SAM enzyme (TIGR01210 family)
MTSVFAERDRAWITAQRPPRATTLDPFRPHAFFLEEERSSAGHVVSSGTILLTNKECPWRCLMCDLWKNTLTETVPPGAIPRQIDFALAQFALAQFRGRRLRQIKLYNSGSFFDSAAIPPADYPAIARAIELAENVVVESHPRLVGEKTLRFRDLLSGSLEVAMGLETIHPQVLPRLNKKFDLGHFSGAAEFLRKERIAMRAFVLVKPPFMDDAEAPEWAVKSAAFAFSCGASAVTLIPTRGGNGAMERLQESGEFAPPRLALLERAQALALDLHAGRVFADTWDLEQFSDCPACAEERHVRLQLINLSQTLLPPVDCPVCRNA